MLQTPMDPDAVIDGSSTLLQLASLTSCIEVARPLLEAGAQPNLQNGHGSTALMTAAMRGRVDLVRLLPELR